MGRFLFLCAVFMLGVSVPAQKPTIFDVSNVVIGAQRTPTLYLLAVGKWSDSGENESALSSEIHCYKALGFCEAARIIWAGGQASAALDAFDILRWDGREIIATDSSPMCVVSTLRVDLVAKRVTLNLSDKGATNDPDCKGEHTNSTAVLLGEEDVRRDEIERSKRNRTK